MNSYSIPAPVFVCLCVRITRYVSLDEGSAVLTWRMNQDRCNTLSTGHLQRLIPTQQQLEDMFYGLYWNPPSVSWRHKQCTSASAVFIDSLRYTKFLQHHQVADDSVG